MQNPFVIKLNAADLAWQIKKALSDPERISDEERCVARPEIVELEQSSIPAPPLTVEKPQHGSEQRRPDAESGNTPPPNRPVVAATLYLSGPLKIQTVEDLRQKAQQCRADAASFTVPELRAYLLKIASEYDRLAARGEQFEERARLPKPSPMNTIALSQWYA